MLSMRSGTSAMLVLRNPGHFPTVALLQNNSGEHQGVFTRSFGSPGRKKKLLTIVEVILMKNRTATPGTYYIIFLRELKNHYEQQEFFAWGKAILKKNVSNIHRLNLRERLNLTDPQRTFKGTLSVLTSCNYCSSFLLCHHQSWLPCCNISILVPSSYTNIQIIYIYKQFFLSNTQELRSA